MSILLQQQSQAFMKIFSFASTVLAFLIVWAFCYAPLGAQMLDSTKADSVQKPRENWYWASGGLGLGSGIATNVKGNNIIALSLALSFAYNNTLWSLNWFYEGMIFGERSNLTIGGMYGWINRDDWSFASVSLGIAYNEAIDRKYRGFTLLSTTYTTGIALIGEAQIALKAYVPGIGLKINGGLGTNDSFLVATLMFHLGWMP